jgi:uncharacterized protein
MKFMNAKTQRGKERKEDKDKNHNSIPLRSLLLCVFTFSLFAADVMAQKLKEVPLKNVKLNDGFWKSKLQTNRTVTVWHNIKMCEETGRVANFKRAAGVEQGPHQGIFFNDSDVYKVIEGASYILAQHPDDKKLDAKMDEWIGYLAKAQRPDGYLYTFYQLRNELDKRFTNLKDHHELYCAGHLIEAGVAHYHATGKRSLLDVAIKYANLIDEDFGPTKRHEVDGHEEVELALFKLADATSELKYSKLASYFIRQRGRDDRRKLFGIYHQDHKPLEQCDQVVGHAVRQMYLLCAAADATARGDRTYMPAMERMWQDLVERKMYITGGVGAKHEGEAFGEAFELPNESAYAETCAGIGSAMWNQRMELLTADGRFADIVEQASYNGILSGVSLSGDKFFYVNPLASDGKHHRVPWFDCACCPPNVLRYLATLPSRVYGTTTTDVYVNIYTPSEAQISVAGGTVKVTQETNYPWDGKVTLTVVPESVSEFTMRLRLPMWCENPTVKVAGESAEMKPNNGYVAFRRKWKAGEKIELDLPIVVRRVKADPRVKANTGRVALARGPLIYCVESADNAGGVKSLKLPADEKLETEHRGDLLGGVTVVKGKSLTAVPYYAWDNRTPGEMAVWIPE